MRGVLVFCFALVQACANSPGPLDYPVDWPLPMTSTDGTCPLPVGRFANTGTSNSPDHQTPPLAAILFEDKLAGFPVESIDIRHQPEADRLLIRGVLAGVELKQQATIVPTGELCESLWQGTTPTGSVNATLRTEAVLYTGGLLLPLSEKNLFSLHLAEDGSLLVRLDVRGTALFSLLIPFTLKDEYWLRFTPYPSGSQQIESPDQSPLQ